MLLIAAVIPIACVAASVLAEKQPPEPDAGERRLPRRTALSVAAMLALVSTLVVAENPVTAAEGDMHTFSGTITDLEQAALAGINVSVFCQNCPDGSTSDPSATPNPARPWPASSWGSGARLLGEAATDASGAWSVTFTEPSSGYLLVVAWDPEGDYALNTIPAYGGWATQSDLNASLADGGRLSGRISGDAGPWPADGFVLSGYANNLLWQGISLVVDANGDYLTPGLPDGEYSLSYPANLARPYVASVWYWLGAISGGMDSTADHDLFKYTSASGRVTDGSGRGLSGIRVVASPVGTWSLLASPVGGRGPSVETGADGTYSFNNMVPGTAFVFVFSSPDGEYASEVYDDQNSVRDGDHVEIPATGAVTGIDAQLAPGGRVSGHVRDAAGEPVPWTGVQLCFEQSYLCAYQSADDSGFFEFGGLAAATYTLQGGGIRRCVIVSEGRHVQVNLDQRVDQEGFIDVPEGAYFSVPVMTLAEQGVFTGTEWGDSFCPDAPIDRKTMAVWTVRVLDGEDPPRVSESRFNDVNSWDFHAPFIERMAELEVTTGCGDDGSGFCPNDSVTRAEMAVFLSRAYDLPDGPDPGFGDVGPDAWYAAFVARLAASGITGGCGDGTNFCPDKDTDRAQMAVFLHRAETRAN